MRSCPYESPDRSVHVGDPMADDVNMGALISAPHLKKVLGYVEKGVPSATLVTGGKQLHPGFRRRLFHGPTILADCDDDMTVVRGRFSAR